MMGTTEWTYSPGSARRVVVAGIRQSIAAAENVTATNRQKPNSVSVPSSVGSIPTQSVKVSQWIDLLKLSYAVEPNSTEIRPRRLGEGLNPSKWSIGFCRTRRPAALRPTGDRWLIMVEYAANGPAREIHRWPHRKETRTTTTKEVAIHSRTGPR